MKPQDEVKADSLSSFTGTPEAYVDLISERWNWVYGTMFVEEMTDEWMKPYWEIKLVTGGWSGNEDVIMELDTTWFHTLFWRSIHRGGLHVFHVPASKWRQVLELGKMP